MTQRWPRMSARFTIMLMIVALLVTALPVAAFAAGPGTSATTPAHDTGKPEKPGKPPKPGKPDKDAACSRKDVKKDSERGVKAAERWHLRLRTEDGKRLGTMTLKDGRCTPRIVVGLDYRVDARVPHDLRPALDGTTIEVQHREEGADTWKTVKEVPVDRHGRIRTTFRATEAHLNVHEYRIAGLPQQSGGAPAAMTTATSPTTSATGVTLIVINIVNHSGNDLLISFPVAYLAPDDDPNTADPYTVGTIRINDGETHALAYQNAPERIAYGFYMTKVKCLMGCTVYLPDWSCRSCSTIWPRSQLDSGPTCGDAAPQLVSGGTYYARLEAGGHPSNDFIRGFLSGPLAGSASPTSTCIFGGRSELMTRPVWQVFLAIELITILIVGIALIPYALIAGGDAAGLQMLFALGEQETVETVAAKAVDPAFAVDALFNGALIIPGT